MKPRFLIATTTLLISCTSLPKAPLAEVRKHVPVKLQCDTAQTALDAETVVNVLTSSAAPLETLRDMATPPQGASKADLVAHAARVACAVQAVRERIEKAGDLSKEAVQNAKAAAEALGL